jgi:hypothetical protein
MNAMRIKRAKKGQGMPINMVIVAAIALVVLVVLILIFTRKIGGINTDLQSCSTRGGVCQEAKCDESKGQTELTGLAGCESGKSNCCISVIKKG